MPACQTRGQAALDESRRYVGRPVGQVVIRGLSTRCRVLILRFAHRRMAVECTRTNHRLCSRRSKQPRLHLHVACNTSRLACWTRETLPNIHYIAKSSSAGPSIWLSNHTIFASMSLFEGFCWLDDGFDVFDVGLYFVLG